MDLFELEIINTCIQNKYVFLMGDFNSRTHTHSDILENDDFLIEHFDLDDALYDLFNIKTLLARANMNELRTSKDNVINNEGRKLLDICKSSHICILNGRCGEDKYIGNFTFRNTSIIDYSIASAEAINYVDNFCVTELDTLFTDNHALLTTTLKFENISENSQIHRVCTQANKRPKWDENKLKDFIQNIDVDKLSRVNISLEIAHRNVDSVNNACIDDICSQISNIFTDSADKTFDGSKYQYSDKQTNKTNKRWFGFQCKNSRKKYHIAKRIHSQNPSQTTTDNLKRYSNEYKRTLNLHINRYNHATKEKLRNLKSKRPKDFWKIINSIDKNNKESNISIDALHNYFENQNIADENSNENFIAGLNIDSVDDEELLNSSITEGEIRVCIKSLKNNKSSSNDNVINEYIKSTSEILLPTYVSFFNLIFDTGLIPQSWLEGIKRPIYKGNGDPLEPQNYRPITILSCFGKLFTAVLNTRLNNYLKYYDLLHENQAGFRAGYSTNDHIFSLYALTELLKSKNKKLFCSFVDFSKAFDSVWRVGLWMKLLGNGITGRFFRVIHNLYHNIKSCVKFAGEQSSFFQSYCGVRQGENLSPVLFALFLNDLEDYLEQHNCNGINIESSDQEISIYLKLLVLLYADDTVIFGTDAVAFQESLNHFYEYTRIWKLNINYTKTKIMIFGIRNVEQFQFRLGTSVISICDEFKYLGVVFSKSRSFYKAMKHNVEHAKKALYLLYKRIRNLHLPLDLQLHLFDHTILPILLYGCEIWGFQNVQIIENVHNQFLRNITNLRRSTPIYMLHAELGRYPIELFIKSRMIGFWISIVNCDNTKITKILYNMLSNESNMGQNYKWINRIKDILISVGRPDLFYNACIPNPKLTKNKIVRTLKDLCVQGWNMKMLDSNKGRNYNLFKQTLTMESYLLSLTENLYLPLIKFRTSNHKLPVEVGRWENIPYEDRKCRLCDKNDIGDEFHYLLICPYFADDRKLFLKPYFYLRPNILKFKDLLQTTNKTILFKLSQFVKTISNTFNSHY